MNYLKSKLNAPLTLQILLGLYLFIYLTSGIYTELKLITLKPLPEDLFQDYKIYERAVNDALKGNNPYEIQKIGSGFLYAPPALLIIDFFQLIKDPDIRKAVFIAINFAFFNGNCLWDCKILRIKNSKDMVLVYLVFGVCAIS